MHNIYQDLEVKHSAESDHQTGIEQAKKVEDEVRESVRSE